MGDRGQVCRSYSEISWYSTYSSCVDYVCNCRRRRRRKFSGSVLRPKLEVKCHIMQHSCLPILLYGIDAVTLTKEQQKYMGCLLHITWP